MWADHESSNDLLGFGHLVEAIRAIIGKQSLLPATIGVFGDWGSGKSSLLKIATAQLKQTKGVLVLEFNGWLFEGYDDAKSVLMETIIDELVKNQPLTERAKKIALRLFRRINWFRVASGVGKTVGKYGLAFAAAGPAGIGAMATVDAAQILAKAAENLEGFDGEKLADALKDETEQTIGRSIRQFREDFAALLEESKVDRLVVVIDDLDRCLPDTIIETLEAIKLFLFVPNSAFVIGADERLVKYAVKRRFPELPGTRSEVGRDYLEKLIQYPIRVPELGRSEMESYISLLFLQLAQVDPEDIAKCAEWASSGENIRVGRAFGLSAAGNLLGKVEGDLREHLGLAARISPILAPGLNGNPRQCKRFLNMLLMRIQMAKSRDIDLSERMLAKLMLLEYLRPETFKRLAALQSEQGGRPEELRDLELHREAQVQPKPTPSKGSGDNSSKTKSKKRAAAPSPPQITPEMQSWLDDSLIREWLDLDPSLRDEDLRPYFHFSRDLLGSMAGSIQRLSPLAQETIERLLDRSEAVRTTALRNVAKLSGVDAAAVFQELTSRARQEEDPASDHSAFMRTFDFVENYSQLAGELVTFLRQMPESRLPIAVVPKLQTATNSTPAQDAATAVIQNWADHSSNPTLRQIASRTMQKKQESQ